MSVKKIRFRRPELAEARFWSKVDKSGDCWEWTASCYATGYGQFQPGYGTVTAHRMSWHFTRGPIPDGLWVLHKCDNRKCVRPDHLFLGTAIDNNRDMCAKGRHAGWSWKRGTSRIKREQIDQIKSLVKTRTYGDVGRQFNISRTHVGRIARGEWVPT